MYSRSFIESHTVYAHDGDLLCEGCGDERIAELEENREAFRERANQFIDQGRPLAASEAAEAAAKRQEERDELEESRTMDDGESDSPRSCGNCFAHIEGALTDRGMSYVADAIRDYLDGGKGSRAVLSDWISDYFSGSLPLPIPAATRAAVLRVFARVDRERRHLERAALFVDRSDPRIGRASGAAAALRTYWVERTYGGDSVRATLRQDARR